MTPSLLTSGAVKLKPLAGRLALFALGCFLCAVALLLLSVTALKSFYTPVFFVVWLLIGISFVSIAVLSVVSLYTRVLPDPTLGGFAAVEYWWNRVGRVLFAPFITLWLAALCFMLLAGIVIALLQLSEWVGLI